MVCDQLSTGTDGGKLPILGQTPMNRSMMGRAGTKSQIMHASDIAKKIDGQKPVVGPIDSILRAQQLREKVNLFCFIE